jgi:hypothetical protein
MSQFEPIFRKKAKGIPLGPFFKTPLCFFETEDSIFKILYKQWTLNILEIIQIIFFYILIIIKHSIYDRISKNQKNQPIIKWFPYIFTEIKDNFFTIRCAIQFYINVINTLFAYQHFSSLQVD